MFRLSLSFLAFAALAMCTDAPAYYVLGPNDQITLLVPDVDEISNKPMRIDIRGDINLPLAGRIHAAGLTAADLEQQVKTRLEKYVKNPEVVVTVSDLQSRPVSVLRA